MPKSNEVVITEELLCLKETPKAFLFQIPGKKESFWIPRSQIKDPAVESIGEATLQEICIPKWLAEEKDLLDE